MTRRKKKDQKETKTKTYKTNGQKSLEKTPEAVNGFQVANDSVFHCACYWHWHTTVFGFWKAWPRSIGAREMDGLPKASMADLLVTKQDPNSCDRVG